MPRIIVFDVNETLLDLSALDAIFEDIFGFPSVRREWFSQVLISALVATVTDAYNDFERIGQTALDAISRQNRRSLSERDKERIQEGLRNLPTYPEVSSGLDILNRSGLRLAALTNSSEKTARTRLQNAGITGYFEAIISADQVKRFKPHPQVYRMAAERLGTNTRSIRMVAAHAWDVSGAMRAGCAAAFVARPGKVLDALAERPDVIGDDIRSVAEKILETEIGK